MLLHIKNSRFARFDFARDLTIIYFMFIIISVICLTDKIFVAGYGRIALDKGVQGAFLLHIISCCQPVLYTCMFG